MSKPAPTPIEKAEWDFRKVDAEPLSLPDATVWEYARTSNEVREAALRWIASRVGGKTIRQHIKEGRLSGSNDASLWDTAMMPGLKAVRNFRLLELITESQRTFPDPWTKVPVGYRRNPKFRRAMIVPMEWKYRHTIEMLERNGAEKTRNILNALKSDWGRKRRSFHITIDWQGHTLKDILEDVETELRKEAKNHPELLRGKAAQAPIEPLKWLAAYRLKLAGHTYESAQKLVNPSRDNRIVPAFADKSGWSDAISRAKNHLAALEAEDDSSWLASI